MDTIVFIPIINSPPAIIDFKFLDKIRKYVGYRFGLVDGYPCIKYHHRKNHCMKL